MVTYREAGELLLKAALSGTSLLTRMSGFISALALLLFGFEWSPLKDLAAHDFGPPVIRLVSYGGIAFYLVATFRAALNSYHERSAINHYEISSQARKERAYRIIHRLLKEGEFIKRTDSLRQEKWVRWDKEVTASLSKFCGKNSLFLYLSMTQRHDALEPIQAPYYDYALEQLKEWIDDDFQNTLN